jgi:hypothetical protein
MLAIAFHGQLLQIGRKALEVLLVGQHSHRLRPEEVVVPDAQQRHQHGEIPLERRGAEMLVHFVKAVQHGPVVIGADSQHGRQADGRVHRITAADPIPEAEHVGRIDAEPRYLAGIGRNRDEMLRDRRFISTHAFQEPTARGVGIGHGFNL